MALVVLPPPRAALLKEKENQHPECQLFYRLCIEGCGLTENHLLDLADFLGSSISHQPHITEISTNLFYRLGRKDSNLHYLIQSQASYPLDDFPRMVLPG